MKRLASWAALTAAVLLILHLAPGYSGTIIPTPDQLKGLAAGVLFMAAERLQDK